MAFGLCDFDIDVSTADLQTSGPVIIEELASKGFCSICSAIQKDVLERALQDVTALQSQGCFQFLPPVVANGLLGLEGSAQIADLESILPFEGLQQLEAISSIDQMLADIGALTTELSRAPAIIHRSGEPETPTPSLSEQQASKWFAQFTHHRLMVIIFLGPTPGTLELTPYEVSNADAYEIVTLPGSVVVLRPDILSYNHMASSQTLAVSSFFLQSVSKTQSTGSLMIPVAKDLDEWIMERLKTLKEKDLEGSPWDASIPVEWQHAMNHMFHAGSMLHVQGASCMFPSSDDPESWYSAGCSGPNYTAEVPYTRWDHFASGVYEPGVDSYKSGRTFCKHMCYMDGVDLFDCKAFNISISEAKGLDPQQRLILEVGYNALRLSGKSRKELNNSSCGVFVGCGNPEWTCCPKGDGSALAVTGAALSISSGRFSFVLGLKGPSITLNQEAASGLTAVYLACDSITKKGQATAASYSTAISAHLLLTATSWPFESCMGLMGKDGNCKTFDASANGYVRGEGVSSAVIKSAMEQVDGNYVHDPDAVKFDAIAGVIMNQNGLCSSLTAPHAPSIQEAISGCIRGAHVSPNDVDIHESFGAGILMFDAVEIDAVQRAYRPEQQDVPLSIGALKSSAGNQIDTSGIASLLKVLGATRHGASLPNLHLFQVNPHLQIPELNLVNELTDHSCDSTFSGILAFGHGGTNVHCTTWGHAVPKTRPDQHLTQRQQILFWPGGGGLLEARLTPKSMYAIVGSWSEWEDPQPMQEESEGTFTYTLVLGENGWEHFQIWLDGSPQQRLHPGILHAYHGCGVFGPDDAGQDGVWVIDGRHDMTSAHDTAVYRITLRIAGKWRNICWEKVLGIPESLQPVAPGGKYYVTSSWNNWTFDEMCADPTIEGRFHLKARLDDFCGLFQIVRNKDWSQVFYPEDVNQWRPSDACGPDDQSRGSAWCISAAPGTEFCIEFRRQAGSARSSAVVSWERG